MATIKNDWNVISQIYSKIFSSLVLESKDRDYWTADGEEDTAIMPDGWDVNGSDTQTLGSTEWTKNVRTGLLNYIQTFQSRFYPVRGGDMEHNSLYPFVFLTFIEQGDDNVVVESEDEAVEDAYEVLKAEIETKTAELEAKSNLLGTVFTPSS
jgi:hypothetical protein